MKITAETIKTVLDYEPETGRFKWKPRPEDRAGVAGWNGRCAGKDAARVGPDGYWFISHLGTRHYVHRLAWLAVHGEVPADLTVDHIDGDRSNNRIANLRLATASQQKANAKRKKTNTSGYKGVFPVQGGKWRAKIVCNRIEHRLGDFKSPEDAHKAYTDAAKRLFGEFARVA